MLLNPGTVLSGRYEITEKIGSGGMAVVYRGKDKKLDRYVTIKVLREEFIGDEDFIGRFRSEACSAARLSHPNIVRAYDVGDDGNIHYIVMEYIHGDTLKKAIKEKAPFDSRSTINVAIQIASALSQAHKSHIIHRDIKPQNILVGTDGVVKVTDFGIARAATASTMTTTANAAGSVHYFSPEQARGGYVDEKSDIYSLGITMFEMITGVLPFQGNNSVSIALKHINEELPDIRQYNPNCSRSLEGIIKKATMKKADERYASIDLLLADLIRARADIATATPAPPAVRPRRAAAQAAAQQEKPLADASKVKLPEYLPEDNVRQSRRAEAEAQLRALQEKHKVETQGDAAKTAQPKIEETKAADPKELDYIRGRRAAEVGAAKEPLASLEKHSKKLSLSKEDEYEKEYVKSDPVKTSKRPEKPRKNPRDDAEYDSDTDRKAERKVVIAAVVTALVLIGIISVFGMRYMGGHFSGIVASEDNTIEVPMLIGVPYEEALKTAENLGIVLVEEGQDYNNYYDAGYIIYQSASEGTMVAKDARIGVKVSLGLNTEKMPNVVGMDEQEAIDAITKLVGNVVKYEYVHDDTVEVEKVVEQEPAAGADITAKSEIRLKISKGEENSEVVVPSVVGSTEEQARRDLTAVGLTVGSVSYANSATVAEGKVITQTISANQKVASGSVVNLVVSKGAEETKPEETTPPAAETPTETTPPPTDTTTPFVSQTPAETTGTKYFTIELPSDVRGSAYVRVVKNDADGAYPVVDEYRDASEFPYSVSITGRGSGSVTCYINDVQQWSQNVNFSE